LASSPTAGLSMSRWQGVRQAVKARGQQHGNFPKISHKKESSTLLCNWNIREPCHRKIIYSTDNK